MGDWTFVNKSVAGLSDQIRGDATTWLFRFVHNETGERVLVVAENEDHAWEKLTDGEYEKEDPSKL
jgi:hypothetical protein